MYLLVLFAALVAYGAGVPLTSPRPRLDGRIVGGSTTTITSFPHQLSLRYDSSHICGASVISTSWAVTAGHCIVGSASRLSLRAGSTYSNSGGTIHQVSQVIRHGSYNEDTIDYDIALLRVTSAFSLSSSIQPIDLQSSSVAAGTNVVVSGWGTTSEGGSASTTLRQVTVQIVSDSSCNSAYSSYGGITSRMICAGTSSGGKDACQGDSGGPLIADGKLVGIVSWGVGCARADYPGVYTKVSALRSWIQSNAGV